MVWRAERELVNGQPKTGAVWVVTRIKGEQGSPGGQAKSIEKWFRAETSKPAAPPTVTFTGSTPDNYFKGQDASWSENKKYLYCVEMYQLTTGATFWGTPYFYAEWADQGPEGDPGVVYELDLTPEAIVVDGDADTTKTVSIAATFWRREGTRARAGYSAYWGIFLRAGHTYSMVNVSPGRGQGLTQPATVDRRYDAVAIFFSDSAVQSVNGAEPAGYVCKREIPLMQTLKGTTGSTGKACYIAGDYSDDIEYTSNDRYTVAVTVPGTGSTSQIYVLTASSNWTWNAAHTQALSKVKPTDTGQTVWEQGVNENLIRAKYLFADFASLGSAVVTGDWMLSRYGSYPAYEWRQLPVVPANRMADNLTFHAGVEYEVRLSGVPGDTGNATTFDLGIFNGNTRKLTMTLPVPDGATNKDFSVLYTFIPDATASTYNVYASSLSALGYVSLSIRPKNAYLNFDPENPQGESNSIYQMTKAMTIPKNSVGVDFDMVNLVAGTAYALRVKASTTSVGPQKIGIYKQGTSENISVVTGSSSPVITVPASDTSYQSVTFKPATSGKFVVGARRNADSATFSVTEIRITRSGEPFVPNFALDMFTGKMYLNDAVVRGEVHATSGTFNGMVKARLFYAEFMNMTEMMDLRDDNVEYIIDPINDPCCSFYVNCGGGHNATMILPQASAYNGLELSFFMPPIISRAASDSMTVKTNNADLLYGTRADGYFYSRPEFSPMGLVVVKSISDVWWIVSGMLW